MEIVIVLFIILLWVSFGIFGFYLEVKEDKYTEKDAKDLVGEFWSCIALGIFSVLYLCHPLLRFIKFLIKNAQTSSEKKEKKQ